MTVSDKCRYKSDDKRVVFDVRLKTLWDENSTSDVTFEAKSLRMYFWLDAFLHDQIFVLDPLPVKAAARE